MSDHNCGQPRPCTCDNYRAGERYTPDQCRDCYLFHCNPLFRWRWSPCDGGTPDAAIAIEHLAAVARHEGLSPRVAARPTVVPSIAVKVILKGQSAGAEVHNRHLRRCVDLGEQIEVRAGCASGWMCRHECRSRQSDVMEHLGEVPEAVPGDDCQDCPGFVDAGRF